ncbi:MAG: translocation/assembly module TamB [Hydrogenimonas sp.]|nr:translocation/assembly module TamB [Hydrogenimonas sp.]
MGKLYRNFANFLQFSIIILGTILFVAAHPETARLLAIKVSEKSEVTFKKIDGSLLYGLRLYGLNYKNSVEIEKVTLSYSISSIFSTYPTIDLVALQGLKIYPKRFEKIKNKKRRDKELSLPPLAINHIEIEDGEIYAKPHVGFDISAKNSLLRFSGFSIKKIYAIIATKYAKASLSGSLEGMRLNAAAEISPAPKYLKKALKKVKNLPQSYPVKLKLDRNCLSISTSLKNALILKDQNVTVSDTLLRAEYLFEDRYLKTKASYRISNQLFESDIDQSAIVTPFGAYAVKINGRVLRSGLQLPFKSFYIDSAGDRSVFMADTYAGPYRLSLYSTDYKSYALNLHAKPHRVDYIKTLPQIISKQSIEADANATLRLIPKFAVEGVATFEGNFSSMRNYFEATKKTLLLRSTVKPKKARGGIWAALPEPFVSDIAAFIYISKEKKVANLISTKASLTLFEERGSLSGWADIGSLSLEAKGSITPDGKADIDFEGRIESLNELMRDLNITTEQKVDAAIESKFHLSLGESLSLTYLTKIPWYFVQSDSQHIYYGLDSTLQGSLKKSIVTIDSYDIGFQDRRFKQKRASVIEVDDNLTVNIEKLAILDTLTARGSYNIKKRSGSFTLKGKRAHYKGPEGSLEADVKIDASLSPEKIDAEGEIFIRDALITYKPKRDFKVEDEDIVIIQDIKEPSRTKKALNIHIYSKKPLIYKIPEVTAHFIPDITLWKESEKPIEILGMVKIVDGSIDAADKHFTILPSEIYFGGSNPINPYLDLHIGYEYDFYKFSIYVSHTLAKPLLLFSSEPPMSQNDIMSYILFGAPADEAFGASAEPGGSIATLLLGIGLKNAIGSATGIKFDTLNILSSQDGGFGIEIGKRIGKRLRILYRNDTVSSFIIQYRASRSIRIDIDVKDTGQGVNILYIKDFGKLKK